MRPDGAEEEQQPNHHTGTRGGRKGGWAAPWLTPEFCRRVSQTGRIWIKSHMENWPLQSKCDRRPPSGGPGDKRRSQCCVLSPWSPPGRWGTCRAVAGTWASYSSRLSDKHACSHTVFSTHFQRKTKAKSIKLSRQTISMHMSLRLHLKYILVLDKAMTFYKYVPCFYIFLMFLCCSLCAF